MLCLSETSSSLSPDFNSAVFSLLPDVPWLFLSSTVSLPVYTFPSHCPHSVRSDREGESGSVPGLKMGLAPSLSLMAQATREILSWSSRSIQVLPLLVFVRGGVEMHGVHHIAGILQEILSGFGFRLIPLGCAH